jgi:transposase-like protein
MQPQRWSSREELVLQVTTLARQGMAVRAIARAMGVARNTVRGDPGDAGRGAREAAHGPARAARAGAARPP